MLTNCVNCQFVILPLIVQLDKGIGGGVCSPVTISTSNSFSNIISPCFHCKVKSSSPFESVSISNLRVSLTLRVEKSTTTDGFEEPIIDEAFIPLECKDGSTDVYVIPEYVNSGSLPIEVVKLIAFLGLFLITVICSS